MAGDKGRITPRRAPRTSRGWQELAGSWGRAGPGGIGKRTTARAAPPAARSEPCASWHPADGDAHFQGLPGQDVILLRGISLTELVAGINLAEAGLSLHLDRDGGIGFVNRAGDSATFSGDLTAGGATLHFRDILKLLLA
ncbi:hypothetical protein [Falsiroseomonas selenitidurans]|uniref:Uncharacterized protein n=1 Tax=Falsiroseomonas selenitidurans TaxID=2716335 RepID=A0ABX1EBA3_9PROT|nr:hypothetical protein [Falsiroseomonas selenitidurans]NKC34520.1 hypothetical protein [Falsiroseomonas selenitidurans]